MSANEQGTAPKQVKAGALDVRVIIGGLLGVFGIVLLITGLVNGSGSGGKPPHSDPDHLNVYVGTALLAAAVVFVGWSRLRPLLVPVEEGTVEAKRAGGH